MADAVRAADPALAEALAAGQAHCTDGRGIRLDPSETATGGTIVGVRLGFKRLAALPQFEMPDRYVNKTRPQLPAERICR